MQVALELRMEAKCMRLGISLRNICTVHPDDPEIQASVPQPVQHMREVSVRNEDTHFQSWAWAALGEVAEHTGKRARCSFCRILTTRLSDGLPQRVTLWHALSCQL